MPINDKIETPSDSDNSTSEPKPQRKIEWLNQEQAQFIYSNNAQIIFNEYDIRIAFGDIVSSQKDKLVVNGLGVVVMSPRFAKVLLKVFEQRVKKYEENFGEIPIPAKLAFAEEEK